MGCNVVQDGLGDSDAVVGAGATTELVENDEGAWCGFGKDLLGLGEFDEECRLGGEDVVVGAESGHDASTGVRRAETQGT